MEVDGSGSQPADPQIANLAASAEPWSESLVIGGSVMTEDSTSAQTRESEIPEVTDTKMAEASSDPEAIEDRAPPPLDPANAGTPSVAQDGHSGDSQTTMATETVTPVKSKSPVMELNSVMIDSSIVSLEGLIDAGCDAEKALAVLKGLPPRMQESEEHRVYLDKLIREVEAGNRAKNFLDTYRTFESASLRAAKGMKETWDRAETARKTAENLEHQIQELKTEIQELKSSIDSLGDRLPVPAQFMTDMGEKKLSEDLRFQISDTFERHLKAESERLSWQSNNLNSEHELISTKLASGIEKIEQLQNDLKDLVQAHKARLDEAEALLKLTSDRVAGSEAAECSAEQEAEAGGASTGDPSSESGTKNDTILSMEANLRKLVTRGRDASRAMEQLTKLPPSIRRLTEFEQLRQKAEDTATHGHQAKALQSDLSSFLEDHQTIQNQVSTSSRATDKMAHRLEVVEAARKDVGARTKLIGACVEATWPPTLTQSSDPAVAACAQPPDAMEEEATAPQQQENEQGEVVLEPNHAETAAPQQLDFCREEAQHPQPEDSDRRATGSPQPEDQDQWESGPAQPEDPKQETVGSPPPAELSQRAAGSPLPVDPIQGAARPPQPEALDQKEAGSAEPIDPHKEAARSPEPEDASKDTDRPSHPEDQGEAASLLPEPEHEREDSPQI